MYHFGHSTCAIVQDFLASAVGAAQGTSVSPQSPTGQGSAPADDSRGGQDPAPGGDGAHSAPENNPPQGRKEGVAEGSSVGFVVPQSAPISSFPLSAEELGVAAYFGVTPVTATSFTPATSKDPAIACVLRRRADNLANLSTLKHNLADENGEWEHHVSYTTIFQRSRTLLSIFRHKNRDAY
ncbi:uncharacterized protein EV422DRAFT_507328 [Fimicolochytrium jonesii]|uniref:uncharacterized protein n=1 Tax=Fimicolochytrium jonesii TaxID=1396493 RepID=UPI0022FE5DC5|nr:uncharacterized protein EV422DRAFT_507328 [Fimicolochytrium jonesii]KAI8819700.1 hypothetical protein EV422DRAFT_507328 [Fimicolochytrium jonesii]